MNLVLVTKFGLDNFSFISMMLLIVLLFCIFCTYYAGCLSLEHKNKKFFCVAIFIICSFALRGLVNVKWNNDYYLYYDFQIFHKPSTFLSYLFNEPYLYSVYAFFNFFLDDKKGIFLAMYWFNFLLTTLFFLWLLFRSDVAAFKKMLLFVMHYFLFGYVLLRNAPAYMLFTMFYYYTFREKKFKWVLLTPLMHISSCLLLITYFHKWNYYFKMLLVLPIIVLSAYFILKPFLIEISAFESIFSKIEIYSQGMQSVGYMHVLFFLCIFALVGLGIVFYSKKMLHPILVTTFLFYSLTFFINPVVAHRFSPYLLFALLLFPFDTIKNHEKTVVVIDRITIFLFPMFVYFLLHSHRVEGLEDFL